MGVQEAEQMRESDEKRKEAVQVKNDGETLCYQVEKQLSDLKEKISTADADDLKKKMEELRQTMSAESADPEEIKSKTKDLQEASWRVTIPVIASKATVRTASLKRKRKNELPIFTVDLTSASGTWFFFGRMRW